MQRTLLYALLFITLIFFAAPLSAMTVAVNTGENTQETSVTSENGSISIEQTLQTSPAVKSVFETRREEGQTLFNERREEIKANRDEWRQELKSRLLRIKDERKRATAEQINTMLNSINGHYTTMLLRVLTNVENILNKIEGRTKKLKEQGENTSNVETKITEARTAIASARTAVQAQADKTYTIPTSDESTLKKNIKETRDALRNDLHAARKTVQAAHAAVKDAGKALIELKASSESE
ncbi:hypothetical protein A3I56_00235 [Candidatus Roizmanbacteria bacterium RIFCSPLOWO2_02_FULL_43_10]|uniref:DUF5667 domain-containing protein n=1 Tax=Candidatus Roizmanbacteria bacterium RIFCSPLOWO2_02_FULL_43_10 TaxID=1802078 RepID=A0A1F7JU70_9BACT|nr:MAG: hypothetical protein A3I56_00235 [Candidatus Roizmanbacteria bacterium RIFCSPLOWO2_02_FULL_43_10]